MYLSTDVGARCHALVSSETIASIRDLVEDDKAEPVEKSHSKEIGEAFCLKNKGKPLTVY